MAWTGLINNSGKIDPGDNDTTNGPVLPDFVGPYLKRLELIRAECGRQRHIGGGAAAHHQPFGLADRGSPRRMDVRHQHDRGWLDKIKSHFVPDANRSEERRVGKECRSRWRPE